MPASSQHPEYYKAAKRWALVRDIIHNDAMKHLPIVAINDPLRSESYRMSGVLTNYTSLTRDGLAGLIFRKPPIRYLPEEIDYIEYDANGEGLTITQFSQRIINELLRAGRCGVLAEYPRNDENLSLADMESDGYRSRLKLYNAESIINWNTKNVGSRVLMSLISLEEKINVLSKDGFEWVPTTQYRVLELDAEGIYTQTVYDNTGREIIEGPYRPTDFYGNYWYEIPFQFIGSEDNNSTIDTIPLYDIAIVNLAHYRNSCDLEESIFLCGQPTTFISASADEFNTAYPEGIQLGSHAYYCVGQGGSVTMVQADPNSLVIQGMRDKEQQIVAIGARIISDAGSSRETAEGARIRYSSQNSALSTLTSNASLGLQAALRFVAMYQGGDVTQVLFNLNDQFYDETADPNLISQQILMLDKGIIAKNDIRAYARKTNFLDITRTDEELDAEATPAQTIDYPVDNNLKQQEEEVIDGEQ